MQPQSTRWHLVHDADLREQLGGVLHAGQGLHSIRLEVFSDQQQGNQPPQHAQHMHRPVQPMQGRRLADRKVRALWL